MSIVPRFGLPALAALALVSVLPDFTDGAHSSSSQSIPAASIVFADSEKLKAHSCRDTTLRVTVINSDSTNAADAQFELIQAGSNKIEPPSAAIEPGRSVVPLTIKHDRSSCASWLASIVRPAPIAAYLSVRGPGGRRDLRTIRIADLSPVNWLAVVVGLALSLIVVKTATPRPLPTGLVLAQPIWGASSASNLGLGAALLTALLGIVPTLETMRLGDRSSYTQLSLLFAAILAASPLVFGLRGSKDSIRGFLTAAYLTLWGAFGQLAAALFLLLDLDAADVLPKPSTYIFAALCVCLVWYLISYTCREIPRVLAQPARAITGSTDAPIARPWTLL